MSFKEPISAKLQFEIYSIKTKKMEGENNVWILIILKFLN